MSDAFKKDGFKRAQAEKSAGSRTFSFDPNSTFSNGQQKKIHDALIGQGQLLDSGTRDVSFQ